MTKTFTMTANVEFEAEDLDDAFIELADYFFKLAGDEPPGDSIFTKGNIDLKAKPDAKDAT